MALKLWRKQKFLFIKRATVILSSESEPTLPAVMPLLKKMEGLLIETETDTTVIKKMKKVMRKNYL
jgi:hypothetical protein